MRPIEDQSKGRARSRARAASSKSPKMKRAFALMIQYQQTIVRLRSGVSSLLEAALVKSVPIKGEIEAVRPRIFWMKRC